MLANVGNISYYSSNAAVCWHVALEKYSGNNEATFSFSSCRTENQFWLVLLRVCLLAFGFSSLDFTSSEDSLSSR